MDCYAVGSGISKITPSAAGFIQRKARSKWGVLKLALVMVVFVQTAHATSVVRDVNRLKEKSWILLPYAFRTESFGFAYGLAGGITGYGQPQVSISGAVTETTNDSFGLYFLVNNFRAPGTKRLFINVGGSVGRFTEYREYLQGNPDYPDERAGANDSSEDNFMTGEGWNESLDLQFRYVLPIGEGRDHVLNRYDLDRGILVNGSTFRGTWNPFVSGRTYLDIEPFFRWQSFSSEYMSFEDYKTSGIGVVLTYDNTDFIDNPTRGSWQRIGVMRDPGMGANTYAWTALDAEAAKYVSLGENGAFRQQVLGINFWTAWSPTWEEVIEDGRIRTINRPPDYYGANLGGFYRMRAFPDRRFHDKAAIYYSLEYRMTPRWQPLPGIKWFRPLEIDWWQLVLFVEAGRVAPEWRMGTLHEDMKSDIGLSIRMMIMRSIGRLDVAVSDQSSSVMVLVGHPF